MKKTVKKVIKSKSCWPGFKKQGIKKLYGKTVNNCVKK